MGRPIVNPDSPTSIARQRRPSLAPADPADHLLGRLLEEMTAAWARGERPLAEDFLARHPALLDQPETAADLIYEEVCLREQHGEAVSKEAILRRFPLWRAELEVLLDCREIFEGDAAPQFPAAGEQHGEFSLVEELGRGAAGVVFLATQPALADRPVVLKLTPNAGCEHLRLARLQHTHIVPLYSVEDDARQRIRALCMPYFGGTSLSRVLACLEDQPPRKRTGKDLLDALDRIQASSPLPMPARGSARQLLARASYVQSICWIGSCLADALRYAHERGLVHLDLKPSNVLLTADGQPMLLDFHLARAPLLAGVTATDGFGGTEQYMSPEQKDALATICEGQPVRDPVDARSDIYSLGVLLYRALGGPVPVATAAALRRANPNVSAGLADVLARCLASDPRARYADANALAADLRRHLKDLPLRGVPNRSLTERWRKWRRRRPYTLPFVLTLAAVVSAALAGAAIHVRAQLERGRLALNEGKARLEERRYAEAVKTLERGLRLAESVPFHDDLEQSLRDALRQAERARSVSERDRSTAELSLLAERVRRTSGGDALSAQSRRELEVACRSFWERRTLILDHLRADDPDAREAVRQDFVDLALFWADLRIAVASDGAKNAARNEALQVLDEAEALFEPSAASLHRREIYAAAAGLAEVARSAAQRRSELQLRSAWEHLALGRSLLESGNTRDAADHFESALALQPDYLWPNFYKGLCAYRLGDYQQAVVAFSVCIGLAPQEARCYCNRGSAYLACGQPERALADFDRALQLEPTLGVAALNRAQLRFDWNQYPDALADLEQALAGGADPAEVYYCSARAKLAQGERTAAVANVEKALKEDPAHVDALKLRERLRRNP